MRLAIITLMIFLFNIPFGYWRANVKKFSWPWILAIHIPVPVIVFMRVYFNIGFAWYTYIFFVAAFFLGQQMGGKLHQIFLKNGTLVTSCLIMDLKRGYFNRSF
jgi:hypothetical protein